MDEEHKQLFHGVFNLAKDPGSADALGKLVGVTKNHFEDEEVSKAVFTLHDGFDKTNPVRDYLLRYSILRTSYLLASSHNLSGFKMTITI